MTVIVFAVTALFAVLTALAIALGVTAVALLAPRLWVAAWDRAEAEANAARAADVEAEKRSAGLEAGVMAFNRMGIKR